MQFGMINNLPKSENIFQHKKRLNTLEGMDRGMMVLKKVSHALPSTVIQYKKHLPV
jgi:hypothetical protein